MSLDSWNDKDEEPEKPFVYLDKVDWLVEEDLLLLKSLENQAVYSGKRLTTDVRVPGRLNRDPAFADFYKDVLKADPETVHLIKEGYYFPFREIPPQRSQTPNNKSAREKKDFAWEELNRLERLGCVQKVDGPLYLELPLSVVFSNKWRLVVDTSCHLNPYLEKRKMKLEDLTVMADLVKEGDFLSTDDLDSGYWHVPLHPSMYPFVGCHMENPATGETQYFQWSLILGNFGCCLYLY